MARTITVTQNLIDQLIADYETERENWGDYDVDRLQASVSTVQPGTQIELRDDLDIDETIATPTENIILGIGYFGINI